MRAFDRTAERGSRACVRFARVYVRACARVHACTREKIHRRFESERRADIWVESRVPARRLISSEVREVLPPPPPPPSSDHLPPFFPSDRSKNDRVWGPTNESFVSRPGGIVRGNGHGFLRGTWKNASTYARNSFPGSLSSSPWPSPLSACEPSVREH